MITAEDLIVHAHNRGHPVRIGDRDQLYPGGRAHVQIQVCDLRDQQRLSKIRHKARSLQPPGEARQADRRSSTSIPTAGPIQRTG
jgi:hypothetical protein